MKRALRFLLTAVLVAYFGIANAQTTRWYGYALGSFGGDAWVHKFISFETQTPGAIQTVSETLPEIQAATYVDGVQLSPKDGFVFDEHPTVYFDNDNTVFGYGVFTDNDYQVYTIDYQVMDPTGVSEQAINSLESLVGQTISIYDLTGRLVLRDCFNGQLRYEGLKPGLYFATVGGCSFKFVNK